MSGARSQREAEDVMLAGFSGSLVSEYFAEQLLGEQLGDELDPAGAALARARLLRHRRTVSGRLGPICGARQVHDLVTAPLALVLGHQLASLGPAAQGRMLVASCCNPGPAFVTTAWGEPLDSVAREATRAAIESGAAWCISVNGREVRLLDARRAYARRFAGFDLDEAFDDPAAFALLWALLRAPAFSRDGGSPALQRQPIVDRVVAASDRHTISVCGSLRQGVLEALARLLEGLLAAAPRRAAATPLATLHEQALTIIYRVLFLLFAESRQLVPTWHPLYRDAYSLEGLVAAAERPGPATGLWEALQAIARLSHAGCHAGDLRVTPFNGRLFSPALTPLAEHRALDDGRVRQVLVALATAPRPGGRARIVYRDLDVEQLGGVYESVLDFAPVVLPSVGRARASVELRAGSGARKATASFYTPRSLATYLVRRTLAPLVADATPDQILALKVVDPAMGSGAFLVAACRFLAAEYASALVRVGRCLPSDIDERDRRGFRRLVVQRCLYGVDLNPTAVQLARLSLWLTSLAPDRPLTFLDHHLTVGNSLVGASLDDVSRRPASGRSRERSSEAPNLFGPADLGPALRRVLPDRALAATRPDDTLADVREKERVVAALSGPRSPLARWKSVLDLWCTRSFFAGGRNMTAGLFTALADHLLTGRSALTSSAAERWLEAARTAGQRIRPFHWTLEFPEAFYAADGLPAAQPGFDAVIGNPPWDMIRADNPGHGATRASRDEISGLLRFAHDAGVYRAQGGGHANLFQLFVERACQLARRGGRIGLVVPWGLLSDHGCAALRRMLFEQTMVDPIAGFENTERIFPIHRSVRFLAFSATTGGSTPSVRARLGERDPAILDELPADGHDPRHFPLVLPRSLLGRLSGPGLAVPDVRRAEDVALLERIARAAPALADRSGWRAEFGRELNATDDRPHFVSGGEEGLPVLEGKHISPFRVDPSAAAFRLPSDAARRLLDAGRTFARPRLAYRDVSSGTNRLTLIAAVVPAGCVTVHSLFCLRSPLPAQAQWFLCGVLNSFVANYAVRFWVSSHVTTAILARLPVPFCAPEHDAFQSIAALALRLSSSRDAVADPRYPELQARVARLYRLEAVDLERILETFPLIDQAVRRATLAAFTSRDR